VTSVNWIGPDGRAPESAAALPPGIEKKKQAISNAAT